MSIDHTVNERESSRVLSERLARSVTECAALSSFMDWRASDNFRREYERTHRSIARQLFTMKELVQIH